MKKSEKTLTIVLLVIAMYFIICYVNITSNNLTTGFEYPVWNILAHL